MRKRRARSARWAGAWAWHDVLVSQTRSRVEHFSRDASEPGAWRYRELGAGDSSTFANGAVFAVDALFEGVFEEALEEAFEEAFELEGERSSSGRHGGARARARVGPRRSNSWTREGRGHGARRGRSCWCSRCCGISTHPPRRAAVGASPATIVSPMKSAPTALLVATFLAGFLLLPACSDDDDATPPPAGGGAGSGGAAVDACDAIVEACHPLDTGSGTPHECHELAESASATAATCEAKKAECLAACTAAGGAGAGGHGGEGGAADHAEDGGAAGAHGEKAGAAGAHDHQH